MQELLTVTGKPMSIGTGLRIRISDYQRAVSQSRREDVKLNHLLARLIAEGLDKREAEAQTHD